MVTVKSGLFKDGNHSTTLGELFSAQLQIDIEFLLWDNGASSFMSQGWHFNWLIHISWALAMAVKVTELFDWVRRQKPGFKAQIKFMKWKTKMKMPGRTKLRYLKNSPKQCVQRAGWRTASHSKGQRESWCIWSPKGMGRCGQIARHSVCFLPQPLALLEGKNGYLYSLWQAGINQLVNMKCLPCIVFSRCCKKGIQRNM